MIGKFDADTLMGASVSSGQQAFYQSLRIQAHTLNTRK
jgi:hypothetical protein